MLLLAIPSEHTFDVNEQCISPCLGAVVTVMLVVYLFLIFLFRLMVIFHKLRGHFVLPFDDFPLDALDRCHVEYEPFP